MRTFAPLFGVVRASGEVHRNCIIVGCCVSAIGNFYFARSKRWACHKV